MRTILLLNWCLILLCTGLSACGTAVSNQADPPAAIAAPQAETSAPRGEFEGPYKVGSTTCTVTPIRMAFAVKCADARRGTPFFFDSTSAGGNAIFVSEDTGGLRDKFIFDDSNYDRGEFIRSDGAAFVVRRLRERM